jgi:LPS O-antigen subunit length determinant protein (WzzB/FepE family)
MKPVTVEWRISEKASLPTTKEAPRQKIFIILQNFKNSKF